MSPDLPVEDRLRIAEEKLIAIEAKAGLVRLSTATLTLIWFAFVAAIAAIVFVVRVDGTMRNHIASDEAFSVRFQQHIESSGHSVSLERISELDRRVSNLEKEAHK